jgi:hypothetical protein
MPATITPRAKVRKKIALFLLLTISNQIVAPTVTYALTSGPTAPEATSFEPVDTTDMVNPLTGDFTYNMPLLEVPGPEGGYPLSLSYHAGIQPNEEASWVGLGWSLNPGAITRNVNGFPDDWYSTTSSRRDFWEGGTRTTIKVGASVGYPGPIGNVSFGLSFSQDTYKGFGVGNYANVSIGLSSKEGSPVSIGASFGIENTPYGDTYVSGGLGIGISTAGGEKNSSSQGISPRLNLGVGASTNFNSISAGFSGGVSLGQMSMIGASIGSNGKGSFSAGGYSGNTHNDKAGSVSTHSKSWSADIPVCPSINVQLGYNKVRYWSDETVNTYTHGSLNGSGWSVINNRAYDSYALLEFPDKDIVDNPDPAKLQGGAFPDFDVYSVHAQGVAGNMRPYLLQGEVMAQNRNEVRPDNTTIKHIEYFSPGPTNYKPEFRFENDFSNSYRQTYPDYANPNLNLRLVEPPFDANPAYGNGDGTYGYSGSGNKLAGSKDIKYFTIGSTGAGSGFVKPEVAGLNLSIVGRTDNNHIAGYSVTNSSGVTYHYNLPAYTYNEEIYQEKISKTLGLMFNRQTRTEGYAYTWYLTAITGPDYVDRNGDQKVNESDWGYWISFEYGKWSDKYNWRNPSQGYHRDEDNEFKAVSMGMKEVYYLNAIRTRSHVALFEKDLRLDAKGASPEIFWKKNSNEDYMNEGIYDVNSSQSLRLDRIYLLNAGDAGIITSASGGTTNYIPSNRGLPCGTCEFPANVLDKFDVNAVGRSLLESKAIKIIDYNYNYSLCRSTPNSFDINGTTSAKSGKLTLASVVFRGKGGVSLTPPVSFDYNIGADKVKKAWGSINRTLQHVNTIEFRTSGDNLAVGDLLETDDVNPTYCGVITGKVLEGSQYIYTVRNSSFIGTSSAITLRTTKNPPYNLVAFDMWGMYKADIHPEMISTNENLARVPSSISTLSSDVWSLREIKTGLGAKIGIEYEGDTYKKPVLAKNFSAVIQSFEKLNSTDFKITTLNPEIDLRDFFTSNSNEVFDALLLVDDALYQMCSYDNSFSLKSRDWLVERTGEWQEKPIVTTVDKNELIIRCANSTYLNKISSTSSWSLISNECGGNYIYYKREKICKAGNISIKNRQIYYGGDIRAKSITIDNLEETKFRTVYSYNTPSSVPSPSGITSYEPVTLEADNVATFVEAAKKVYRRELYKDLSNLYALSRELPSPGVMYEYVTIEDQVYQAADERWRTIEGKTRYQFEVFRENMIARVDASPRQSGSDSSGQYRTRNLVLKKFMTNVGALKQMTRYDVNGKTLSQMTNHYLHDGLESSPPADFMITYEQRLNQFNYQGLLKGRFSQVKEVREDDGTYLVKTIFTGREEYPAVQTGQTTKDFLKGITTRSDVQAFDFYSGAVTRSIDTDAFGNRFMTEVTPAYRKYGPLGLKTSNGSNKNMLSQEASSYVYKVDNTNTKLGLVSASAKVWSNSGPVLDQAGVSRVQNTAADGIVWRPQATYNWMPDGKTTDGLTSLASFTDFDYTTPASSHANWKKVSEIVLYDVYSKALEAKDVNNNSAASRLGYKNSRVVLSGSPAKFYEIAFSGAEDETIDGGVSGYPVKDQGVVTAGIFHTGGSSLKLATGAKGFTYTVATDKLVAGRPYTASVWVKPASGTASDVKLYYEINGVQKAVSASSAASTKKAGGWTLIHLSISGSDIVAGATLKVGCRNDYSADVYADDFRFQPVNAGTTAYVYDQFTGELKYALNNNNLYVKYDYDESGRLKATYVEKLGQGEYKAQEHQVFYKSF